eukprot:m.76550 g.76550  ORF g.76550 m.76550 type:complete len:118 (-) comp11887_c0_seq1:1327-1680(-)
MSFLRSSFKKKKGSSSRSGSVSRKKKKKRGKDEDDDDSDWGTSPISLSLGNYQLQYDHGRWSSEMETSAQKSGTKGCKKCADVDVRKLQEENRLLKFKIEVLVDMLTLARAENDAKS